MNLTLNPSLSVKGACSVIGRRKQKEKQNKNSNNKNQTFPSPCPLFPSPRTFVDEIEKERNGFCSILYYYYCLFNAEGQGVKIVKKREIFFKCLWFSSRCITTCIGPSPPSERLCSWYVCSVLHTTGSTGRGQTAKCVSAVRAQRQRPAGGSPCQGTPPLTTAQQT